MNHRSIDKIFGYMVIAVVGYFVVGAMLPYLIMGIIGLLALRFLKRK